MERRNDSECKPTGRDGIDADKQEVVYNQKEKIKYRQREHMLQEHRGNRHRRVVKAESVKCQGQRDTTKEE